MLGKIIIYTLTAEDAAQINRRRTTPESIADRIKLQEGTDRLRWPDGAQAHIGNRVTDGDRFPMLVTVCLGNWPGRVSGQVFLDGNDTLWVTNKYIGDPARPGEWECVK